MDKTKVVEVMRLAKALEKLSDEEDRTRHQMLTASSRLDTIEKERNSLTHLFGIKLQDLGFNDAASMLAFLGNVAPDYKTPPVAAPMPPPIPMPMGLDPAWPFPSSPVPPPPAPPAPPATRRVHDDRRPDVVS